MDLRAKEFAATATQLGVAMVPVPIRESGDIDAALAGLAANRPDAIMIVTDPVMGSREAATLQFLAPHRLPAMYEFGEQRKKPPKNGAFLIVCYHFAPQFFPTPHPRPPPRDHQRRGLSGRRHLA